MGISTDALHFYGVAFTDTDEDAEITERIHELWNGPEDPDAPYYDDYELEDFFARQGLPDVRAGHHCSSEYVMYYLAIESTMTRAYRGTPGRADDKPHSSMAWKEQIWKAGEVLGISFDDNRVGWWVASYYSQ